MNDPSASKLIHVWAGALPTFRQGADPIGFLGVDSRAVEFSGAGVRVPDWRVEGLIL